MKRFSILIFCVIFFSVGCFSQNLKKAKTYYQKGEYELALPLFKKEYNKNKKNVSINHWLGVCYFETGKLDDAIKYLEFAHSKEVLSSSYYLAQIYFKKFDFEKAVNMYSQHRELMVSNNKTISETILEEERIAKLVKPMLDHVEKIIVLDSILVDKQDFFKYYKISQETGTLLSSDKLPFHTKAEAMGYCEQNKSRLLWAMPDETGALRLCQSLKLIDGTWDTPQYIDENIADGGDLNYPFLLQDGMTLYYASNGANSIGGYDIFYTRKDAETGEFLQPQNLGMPYNSFANDYMFVLDDITGYGWWATERNNIEGKVTIYVFKRNDVRINYSVDETNLISYAKLTNFKNTWGDDDYSQELNAIESYLNETDSDNLDFVFAVSKGVIYTSYDDFKSSEALDLYKEYFNLQKKLKVQKQALNAKRKKYASDDANKALLGSEIISLETDIEELEKNIYLKGNEVRRKELENNK